MTEKENLRKQSEAMARKKQTLHPRHLDALSPEESRKLLHELQAHQMALTMQNEELQRVQAELSAARDRYFDLFDMAPVGYLTLNEQGLILEANFTAADLLGMERTALANEPLPRFIHPNDHDVYYHHRKALFETGKPQTCDMRMVRADGTLLWAILNAAPAQSPDGTMVCRIVINENTERKRAEESLNQEKNFTEAVIASVPGFLYVYDDQGNLKKWNKKLEEVSGYSTEELSHMTIPKWFEGEDSVRVETAVEKVFATGYGEVEANLLVKSGENPLTHFTGVRLTMNGKTYLLGVGIDITERRRAEETLRKSEERYRGLIDLAVDGILLGSHEGIITGVNQQMCAIAGIAQKIFIGKHISDLPFTRESLQKNPFRFDLLQKGETVISERTLIRPNGSEVSVEMRSKMMPDGTYQSIYRDTTERKILENQLRQAQKMESVGRLAGGVAHDFNNMLGVILGFVELMLDKMDPADPLHANLMEIRKAAQRSADLTIQLLTFARKQPVTPRALDLNATVAGILKILQRQIGDDIALAWRPGAGQWPVNMDPAQIERILSNLCANARDAISGKGKVTIQTETTTFDAAYNAEYPELLPGEYVVLTVSDTGCGMGPETLDRLFEPFFTTKEMGNSSGLGLSTVYGIIKQNSGFIYARSEPGQGTTFKIFLPRHKHRAEETLTEQTPRPAIGGKETILLVEDEPAVLKVVQMMLSLLGYTVAATQTPDEAFHLAAKQPGGIDLLITDVVMPGMNGRDLANKLLSLYPNLQCLFMSGYTADIISHNDVLEEGIHFIQKPFLMQALAAKVREVMRKANDE